MPAFYKNFTKTQRIVFLIFTILLSIPLGGIGGGFIGLVLTTFIPMECGGGGCHNAFEWNGKIGYEATGSLGFWIGMIIVPIIYVIILIFLLGKKSK